MKVYFTASTIKRTQYIPQCRRIIEILAKKCEIVSGRQIVSESQLAKDRRLGWKKIFKREQKRIEEADCVIAEVSAPSTGVGVEIVHALSHHKQVLALFYQQAEDKLSVMIAGNPSDHLYLEYYDDENLEIKLRDFLEHVTTIKSRKGKLIVLDGGDGSGKATQAEMLVNYFKNKGAKVKYYDFPRYYNSFHGKFVGRFLSGEFGGLDDVSPYLASLTYALDRASAREEMEDWLKHGGYIVSNRYVTSSLAHQAARLPANKRPDFMKWLNELEYKQHKMPRPDLVLYLYVPWKIGLALTKKKANNRKYVKGLDIAEKDIRHRMESEKMYLALAKRKDWVKIDCVDEKGELLSKDVIHKMIVRMLKEKGVG